MNDIKKWPCIVFWMLLFALYSYWTWTPQLNDLGGDSAVYLLTAQHWSFFGDVNPAAARFASASIYPPLYSGLLALFASGQAWLVAHQITAFCGIASLFVLWRWLRIEGFPFFDSLIVIAVVALVPGIYLQALYIHSEFLFMFFVCICLYAIACFEREPNPRFVLVASVASAGACLTRTAGLSLLVALTVYLLLRRAKKEGLILLVSAVLPVLAWTQFGQPAGTGYLVSLTERLAAVGSPDMANILRSQFAALADGYQQNLAGEGSSNIAAVLIFSFGCLVAWIRRLTQGKLDALFLGAYFAVLLVWPFPAESVRFITPVVPIIVLQLVLALHNWAPTRNRHGPMIGPRLAIVVLTIVILPTLLLTVKRHFEPMPSEMEGYRQSPLWYGAGSLDDRLTAIFQYRRLQTGYEELQVHVPLQECVYSIKPSLVALLAQRNSLRSPLPNSSLGKALDPRAVQCKYVHMIVLASPTYPERFYPLKRWQNGMDIRHVTHLIPSDETSNVVAVLGRVR